LNTFTLALRIGHNQVRVAGSFRDGRFEKRQIAVAGGKLDLQLNRLPSGRVHGRVSNGALIATFDQVPYSKGGISRALSRPICDVLLRPASTSQGDARIGWGQIRQRGNDRVKIVGALPDGTPFIAGFQVGLGTQYGIYVPFPGGSFAQLAGTLHFSGIAETTVRKTKRIPGSLGWKQSGVDDIEVRLEAISLR
jgi:hypothetical protein